MTTYIPYSLFKEFFPDDSPCPKTQSKDRSDRDVATEELVRLRTRAVTTYPQGRIVVGRALPEESGDDVVELTASQLVPLPFYENGDLLAIEHDLVFVREELLAFFQKDIFAEGEFSMRLFSGQSGIDIGILLQTKLKTERIAPAYRNQYKLEMVIGALGTFLGPCVGYANPKNRRNWLEESHKKEPKSWIDGALRGLRHHVVKAIEPDSHLRRGSGETANSNNFPIEEYVRIENALAQIYCLRNSKPNEYMSLTSAFTDKPSTSRKAIDAVQLSEDFRPPPYLGDIERDLRDCLTAEDNCFYGPHHVARRPEPPLTKYYGAKKTKLLNQSLVNQKNRVRAGLAAYIHDVDDCEKSANEIVVYQFDVFMYDKQVRQVSKGLQFRSFLPKDERLRPILDKLASTDLASEDCEMIKALMSPVRRTLPRLVDSHEGRIAAAASNLKERSIALAELTPMEEWIYCDANEFDIPERLEPWAHECSKISLQEKTAMLRQIHGRVQQAAQELTAQKFVEDDE